MKIFLPALMVVIGTGCAELPRMERGVSHRDWNRTRAETRRNVEAGNYHAVDRLLAEFARVHPNTREARETVFWRAAYQIDPANSLGSLETGVAGLDVYLANEPEGWHRNEAAILRRTAVAAQGLASGARRAWAPHADTLAIVTQSRDTPPRAQRSRDEEIAELRSQLARSRTQLAQANAELERIKKRLANPSPE